MGAGLYYRVYLTDYGRPDESIIGYIDVIPRDPVELEDWITETTKALEDRKHWDRLFPRFLTNDDHGSDDEVEFNGEGVYHHRYFQILDDSDPSWTLGAHYIWYTYVIDFDNRVFTFGGTLHFRLDNLPPVENSQSEPSLVAYIDEWAPITNPDKYLKTVDFWPPPRFNTPQAQQKYSQLRPLIVAPSEWGAPTWDKLTAPQHLATSLIRTLVEDYTDELTLAHFPSVWHKVGLFCWQVANTAATSHLFCPPLDATPHPASLYTRCDLIKHPVSTDRSIQHHLGGQGTVGRYCWFRGCLVTFCPRLDEPAYLMHQVSQMVENLRKHDRTTATGIVMSGCQVVAIAVDGLEVRHSPVLDLHDGKELQDGILLLMHLLSPTFTISKAPWRNDSTIHQPKATLALPEDIIQHIIHFTDWDTYLTLPSVSQYFRSVFLSYPRVGHSILLGHETNANAEPLFRVRSTGSTSSTIARLVRISSSVDNRFPLWKYCTKSYQRCVLKPGLAETFQHLQTGTGPPDSNSVATQGIGRIFFGRVRFRDVVRGDKHPDMRIQAIDGLWEMVATGLKCDPDTISHTWDGSRFGIDIGELMIGFQKEDLDELSEVEGGWYLS